MIDHDVHTRPSEKVLPREQQLAWHPAGVAANPVPVTGDVAEMMVNRVIDNAAGGRPRRFAGVRSFRRVGRPGRNLSIRAEPRSVSRAASRPRGRSGQRGPVREPDFHDALLAAEYSHPGNNIPADLAVDQHAPAPGSPAGEDRS